MATDSSHRVIIEENGVIAFSRLFLDQIVFILADKDVINRSLNEFEILPDPTPDCGVSCP